MIEAGTNSNNGPLFREQTKWINEAPAVLQTFYSGMEGGSALARLIFGDTSPSGRLPFTVARSSEQYPFFDCATERITYDYWHGYHRFDNLGLEPRYPFGFGLTYSKFEYSGLTVSKSLDGGIGCNCFDSECREISGN
ncbi:MAG: hypothetical protein B7Z22_08415 [Hyphomonas sp. 32-62-5]|nr:MAG: hypothetical protein B7Z22_08415 [Hyphomonas sp. 32-62-5]